MHRLPFRGRLHRGLPVARHGRAGRIPGGAPTPDPLAPDPWTSADGSVNAACLAQLAYDPHRLLRGAHADVPPRFRATLHIDLLEA